jgi:hypothetical protein|tara:strand:+ start:1666 stop:1800 length:135 start_codon:yes stop_codon:yes gene_type:complete
LRIKLKIKSVGLLAKSMLKSILKGINQFINYINTPEGGLDHGYG